MGRPPKMRAGGFCWGFLRNTAFSPATKSAERSRQQYVREHVLLQAWDDCSRNQMYSVFGWLLAGWQWWGLVFAMRFCHGLRQGCRQLDKECVGQCSRSC